MLKAWHGPGPAEPSGQDESQGRTRAAPADAGVERGRRRADRAPLLPEEGFATGSGRSSNHVPGRAALRLQPHGGQAEPGGTRLRRDGSTARAAPPARPLIRCGHLLGGRGGAELDAPARPLRAAGRRCSAPRRGGANLALCAGSSAPARRQGPAALHGDAN